VYLVLAIAASGCGSVGVARLPSPPPPEDPDMSFPPSCASAGVTRCARACDKDDAAACLWVAHAWDEPGPRRNAERAHTLTTRACERDFPRACAELGLAVASRERAKVLLRGACEDGYGRACVGYVARVVLMAPPFDWAAARPWLERGCEADDALACVVLGDLLRTGQGIAEDAQLARERLHRACELGRSSACDEEAAGESRLHALYNPDPRVDEIAGAIEGDAADVRVRFCVGPGGDVVVRQVEAQPAKLAALVRAVVSSWRYAPTGRAEPACNEVVFAIAAQ
jgi:hypothetical protein